MTMTATADALDALPLFPDAVTLGRLFNISRRSPKNLADKNLFPKPVRVGSQWRWHRDEVIAWVATQMSGRKTEPAPTA